MASEVRNLICCVFNNLQESGIFWTIKELILNNTISGPSLSVILGNYMVDMSEKYFGINPHFLVSLRKIILGECHLRQRVCTLKSCLAAFNNENRWTIFDVLKAQLSSFSGILNSSLKYIFQSLLPHVNSANSSKERAKQIIALNKESFKIELDDPKYGNLWLHELSLQVNSSNQTDTLQPIDQPNTTPSLPLPPMICSQTDPLQPIDQSNTISSDPPLPPLPPLPPSMKETDSYEIKLL